MQLALGNVQGEFSPLEIGIHAIGIVEKGYGGAGQTGENTITAYAEKIGRKQQYVSELLFAAEVYKSVPLETHSLSCEFQDKAKHLSHIHCTPARLE